jgi:hypothetical protein
MGADGAAGAGLEDAGDTIFAMVSTTRTENSPPGSALYLRLQEGFVSAML